MTFTRGVTAGDRVVRVEVGQLLQCSAAYATAIRC